MNLRGHGIVAVGELVQQAVVRALNVTALAKVTLLARQHRTPPSLSRPRTSRASELGGTFNDEFVWRSYVARLDLDGLAV